MLLRITGLLVLCCSGFTSGQHWDVRLQAQQGNAPQQFGAAITPPRTTPTTAIPTTTEWSPPPIPEHVPPLPKNLIYCEVNHFGDSSGDMLECGHVDTKRFDEGELAFEGWNTVTCLIAAPPGSGYRDPAGPYAPGEYAIAQGQFISSKFEQIKTPEEFLNYEIARFALWKRYSDGSITDKSMKDNEYLFPGDLNVWGRTDQKLESPPRYEMRPPLADGNYILNPFDWECMKDLVKMFIKAPIVKTRYGDLVALHLTEDRKLYLPYSADHIWIGWLKYIDQTNPRR